MEDYNPRVILINGGINIKTSDLVITKSELFLLKKWWGDNKLEIKPSQIIYGKSIPILLKVKWMG
ncbi:hypothetical protein KZ779_23030 [Escherichia coli]|nr:hypothetical protein [Escherichia coli]